MIPRRLGNTGLLLAPIGFGAFKIGRNQGLKYDPSLLWIDDADRQAKWYQQLKREWIAHRREGRAFANPVKPAILKWRRAAGTSHVHR